MTKNAKWSQKVCDRDGDLCRAEHHHVRCRGRGEQAHRIVYKSHSPAFTHFTVLENGIWISRACHDLAHRTKNGNISFARRRSAILAVNAKIRERAPHKPELLIPEIAA